MYQIFRPTKDRLWITCGLTMSNIVRRVLNKKTKLGQIPSHWSIVNLYDVRDESDRYSFAGGPFGSDLKRSDYTEKGVRILQLQKRGDLLQLLPQLMI